MRMVSEAVGVLLLVLGLAGTGATLAAGQDTGEPAERPPASAVPPAPPAASAAGATANRGGPAVITPQGAAPAPVVAGPGVEIITGGSSTNGAAKVGRMPVIQ